MPYAGSGVSRRTRILFPIVVSIVAGLVAPSSVALVGFLMFGNLIRECGVLESLSKTAQHELANLITLLLGITISFSMRADQFVTKETLIILCLGLVAFVLDSVVGVLFAKLLNLFSLPDVRARDRKARHGGRPHQPPADARGGSKRFWTDRLGRGRRRHPRVLHVRKGAHANE